MRGFHRFGTAALILAGLALSAGTAWGQANNTNNGGSNNSSSNSGGNTNTTSNGLAFAPAGVIISPEGVLRVKPFTDRTGDLTRTRIAESRGALGADRGQGQPAREKSRCSAWKRQWPSGWPPASSRPMK